MLLELMRSRQKVLLFAIMGAGGALLAALVGELWLGLTRRPPTIKREPLAVCLLLDCSGSMADRAGGDPMGTKLDEMKAAAAAFVGRHQAGNDELAVVGFDHRVYEVAPRSTRHDTLQPAIRSIRGGGRTNMGAGLRAAASQLQGTSLPGNILLFTDGMPTESRGAMSPSEDTLQAAHECRARNVKIIAIATGDADVDYLGQLTGDAGLVFPASAGEFERAFQKAETVMFGRQLVDTGLTAEGLGYAIFRIGTWTALLAAGISLALIAGQNLYLRRPMMARPQAIAGGVGGLAAGLTAGVLGQVIFAGAATAPGPVVALGRLVGWTVLGALAGGGLAFFVPNLKLRRGLEGGLVGGLVGAIGFLLIGLVLGDIGGRLFGAAIVGFCIGAMIALAEAVFREAWLEIQYGPRESRTVSLGRQTVTIGSNPEVCTVLARGAAAVALRYALVEGRITCEDVIASHTFDVAPGDRRTVGNLGVVVCAAVPSHPQARRTPTIAGRPEAKVEQPVPKVPGALTSETSGKGGFQLCIRGRRIALAMGAKLITSDIAGLETTTADRAVAEVVANPTDPNIAGLKNLSTRPWTATLPTGEKKDIQPGLSIRLAIGTKIHFGVLEGIVE